MIVFINIPFNIDINIFCIKIFFLDFFWQKNFPLVEIQT